MTSLTEQQKQLIFDYCIGISSESESAQAHELIFANDEASKLLKSLKTSFSPLDTIADEVCPDELADGAIWRAQQAVRTGQVALHELLKAEQLRTSGLNTGFWRNLTARLATAAVFMIVGTVLLTGGRLIHQRYWQQQCGNQLAGMFNAVDAYRSDNNGQMPALATTPGAPWWKIGYKGPENVSNTRKMWILVKNNYAKPGDFVCPAMKEDCDFGIDPAEYNDFPNRKYVTYSFRISCPKSPVGDLRRQIIVADLNPAFEILPSPSTESLNIKIIDELLKLNSPNHKGRGQNALFCDGSVRFLKNRHSDASLDDIFTLQNKSTYEGTELPTCESDSFLAP